MCVCVCGGVHVLMYYVLLAVPDYGNNESSSTIVTVGIVLLVFLILCLIAAVIYSLRALYR